MIEVTRATESDRPLLARLLELYVYDFSEFLQLEIGEDGQFGYPPFQLYWQDADRHPFLIRVKGKLAGFALVRRAETWDMAEFFVLRGYRKRGIGKEAAWQVWAQFPGTWKVRVMEANRAALPFWEKAIGDFVGAPVPWVRLEDGGRIWQVFSFESKPPVHLN